MRKPFLTAASIWLALAACNKAEILSYQELLTRTVWQVEDVKLYDSVTHGLSVIDPCNYDNTLHFSNDGKVIFDYGADKCDSNEIRQNTYSWELQSNNRELVLAGQCYQLEVLSKEFLRFRLKDYQVPGWPNRADIYFMYKPKK